MDTGAFPSLDSLLAGLQLFEHELLLFAAFWFIVGAVDELAFDLCWLWLRLTGRLGGVRLGAHDETAPLSGRIAVLVPAWREADVITAMIEHTVGAWPQEGLALYIGCYANDDATIAAAIRGAGNDHRVRVVIHEALGPTTKADCLNRLYRALCDDERRAGFRFTGLVLHDAEDMVHPAALSVIDRALAHVDFVQLPVRPEPQAQSPRVAGHYADEFTESHAKGLVVRDALGAAIPAAGVGCGFARKAIDDLVIRRAGLGGDGPFAEECLTEDYELGLLVSQGGARSRFLRLHDQHGELVATRAYFPATIETSVRQKSRWLHGIAFQGWERLGWTGRPVDLWMAMRDRRGPLTAIVLAAAYLLLAIEGVLALARLWGWQDIVALSPVLKTMLAISFAAFAWRALWRFAFTASEYGLAEGVRAVLRIPVANVVAIMAGRRALSAYIGTLRGEAVHWDKTEHSRHPAHAKGQAKAPAIVRASPRMVPR